jgi:hypothetical protein
LADAELPPLPLPIAEPLVLGLLPPEPPLPDPPGAEPDVEAEPDPEPDPDDADFSFGCPVALSRQWVAAETEPEPGDELGEV